MITCDTSVVVAAFGRWHADHQSAQDALAAATVLIDHVGIESFSVLTRLPPPRRAPAELVRRFLDHHFPPGSPRLANPSSQQILRLAQERQVTGGAVYDLLIAVVAASSAATLLTLDKRAATTYRAAGSTYTLLTDPT